MERYREACMLLPQRLRQAVLSLEETVQAQTEEIRLRAGRPLSLVLHSGEYPLSAAVVRQADLEHMLDLVTEYSRYTAEDTMRQGFLTARGGFRLGLCGSMVMERGEIRAVRELSSLALRIPREKKGIAQPLLEQLSPEGTGRMGGILVSAPPGGGKTTLLRDMVRCLSDCYGQRVALVDERGELAAVYRGEAQLDVGQRTDVMTGCPKARAIDALLRAMNPQVIAVDEVVLSADVQAMLRAAHSGVTLLGSIHGDSLVQLRGKPLFAAMLSTGIFQHLVQISMEKGVRRYKVEEIT